MKVSTTKAKTLRVGMVTLGAGVVADDLGELLGERVALEAVLGGVPCPMPVQVQSQPHPSAPASSLPHEDLAPAPITASLCLRKRPVNFYHERRGFLIAELLDGGRRRVHA